MKCPSSFFTTFNDNGTRRRALNIQPEAYLTKPLDRSDLKEAIETIAS